MVSQGLFTSELITRTTYVVAGCSSASDGQADGWLGVPLGFCCSYQVIASYLLKLAGIEATYRRLPDISWVIHQETESISPDQCRACEEYLFALAGSQGRRGPPPQKTSVRCKPSRLSRWGGPVAAENLKRWSSANGHLNHTVERVLDISRDFF